MARYVDSKCKLCRRETVKLFLKGSRCETVKCSIVKRKTSSPGQRSKRVKKLSDYGVHFREKQKLKRFYGIFERQFRNYFANGKKGIPGRIYLFCWREGWIMLCFILVTGYHGAIQGR